MCIHVYSAESHATAGPANGHCFVDACRLHVSCNDSGSAKKGTDLVAKSARKGWHSVLAAKTVEVQGKAVH